MTGVSQKRLSRLPLAKSGHPAHRSTFTHLTRCSMAWTWGALIVSGLKLSRLQSYLPFNERGHSQQRSNSLWARHPVKRTVGKATFYHTPSAYERSPAAKEPCSLIYQGFNPRLRLYWKARALAVVQR
jgi:hypothetical protein